MAPARPLEPEKLNDEDRAYAGSRFAEVVDALGELTNMIGGNVKSLLPAPSQLSLPMVSESVWPTTVPGSVAVCRIAFTVGTDVAHISVWQS